MPDKEAGAAPGWAIDYEIDEPLRITTDAPGLESLPPFEKVKVKWGEPFSFGVDVIAEPVGQQGKRGILFPSTPNRNVYELVCDEGKAFGGRDIAPAPLSLFVSGVAFCMLSHLAGYLHQKPLKIRRIRLEIRGDFWSSLPKDGDFTKVGGGCNAFDMYFIVDGDEPPEVIREFVETAHNSCIAMQTILNPVPARTHIIHNGAEIDGA